MVIDKKGNQKRILVLPGELLSEEGLKSGNNTYRQGEKVYSSQLGFKSISSNYMNVIPLSGRYSPKPNDLVIGIVMSVSPTTWLIEINSPYPAPLHVNEVPWRVEFGDTSRYLKTGDTILAKVFNVDEIMRVQVSMKDHGSRKLSGGQIIEVSPTKVPRIIGKGGSMISLIKKKTQCRLFVGQNGRIWIDGEVDNIRLAMNAVRFIEVESHRYGLTQAVEEYLDREIEKIKKGEDIKPTKSKRMSKNFDSKKDNRKNNEITDEKEKSEIEMEIEKEAKERTNKEEKSEDGQNEKREKNEHKEQAHEKERKDKHEKDKHEKERKDKHEKERKDKHEKERKDKHEKNQEERNNKTDEKSDDKKQLLDELYERL